MIIEQNVTGADVQDLHDFSVSGRLMAMLRSAFSVVLSGASLITPFTQSFLLLGISTWHLMPLSRL